jgi:hypothetical protein
VYEALSSLYICQLSLANNNTAARKLVYEALSKLLVYAALSYYAWGLKLSIYTCQLSLANDNNNAALKRLDSINKQITQLQEKQAKQIIKKVPFNALVYSMLVP